MKYGKPEVATAYFYRSASLLSRIADILGKQEDAAEYADLAEKIKKAYRFTCTKDGAVDSDRQCAYVRPVAFGLLDGEENQAAADRLNDLVVDNGYRLNTGFLSTPDLCRVLSDYGHADTAYSLLLNPECPGWLYAVRKGATTIWETWDGIRPDGTVHDSLNHYAYGAVTGWLFDSVCGIRLSAGRLKIAPKPCRDLKYARAKRLTPAGEIRSEWCYDEDTLRLHFAVPADAVLSLPDGRELTVTEGEYDYELPV